MCGRYALALLTNPSPPLPQRPSQVRRMLEDDDMPVHDAPADEGDGAPRQSYNFAPGYHGVVYRADVPDWGAGPRREVKSSKGKSKDGAAAAEEDEAERSATATATSGERAEAGADADASVGGDQHAGGEEAEGGNDDEEVATGEARFKLQSMKWGLVPFWTKRNPDYGAVMKTINCRDDSLAQAGGMWASMKGRKRCVVLAQGFYEWLKSGREKVPHFVRRRDGKLMCFAGLWDCVKYEDDDEGKKHYTYTIITTSSNKQLSFLHDRMPVILDPASAAMRTWLDPSRHEWSGELQRVLVPFGGEVEVYPVSRDVGKVGNDSPSFIIPVASRENKSNIANFFANAQAKEEEKKKKKVDEKVSKESTEKMDGAEADLEVEVVEEEDKEAMATSKSSARETKTVDEVAEEADDGGMMCISPKAGEKRKGDDEREGEQPPTTKQKKKEVASSSPTKPPARSPVKPAAAKGSKTISATRNGTKSPAKGKESGSQKITKFFGNSA